MPARACPGAGQHPRAAGGQQRGQLRRPAGADDHPARGGELERFHARAAYPGPAPAAQSPLPAGKTAENLVEARGCAIISATVSRQVA